MLNLLNASDPASRSRGPDLECDAWYGEIEVQGTTFGLEAGFSPDDTVTDGGQWIVQAVITEGGTGAEQYATFKRYVTIPAGALVPLSVRIPGSTVLANNGAARAKTVSWHNGVPQDVTLTIFDFAGTAIDFIRPRTAAAVLPYGPLEWPLDPSAEVIQIAAGGALVANAAVLFRYK